MATQIEIVNQAAATSGERPLFIPLRTEHFRKFEDGSKTAEYRAYGPRWNERTCRVGRKATVSHGYSGKRLKLVVADFKIIPFEKAPYAAKQIFPDAAWIAAIHLRPL